jgi:hypothetical protein
MAEHVAHDVELEQREQLAEAYANSSAFIDDSLDWACTHAWRHPKLVDLIADYYIESQTFADVLDDALDGEVRW